MGRGTRSGAVAPDRRPAEVGLDPRGSRSRVRDLIVFRPGFASLGVSALSGGMVQGPLPRDDWTERKHRRDRRWTRDRNGSEGGNQLFNSSTPNGREAPEAAARVSPIGGVASTRDGRSVWAISV
jgi:hypothetical protein